MPTTSIVEQIAVAVLNQLRTTVTGHGYEVNTDAIRPSCTWKNFSPVDGKVVLKQFKPRVRAEDSDYQGNPPALAWWVPFSIYAFVVPGDASTDPVDTLLNAMCSSIEKSLMTDPQWAGLAIDSRISPPEFKSFGDTAADCAEITFEVLYRTKENDPYTNRV